MKVKKILAGFLSAAMIFSLMPTTVFATESDMPGDESSNAPVVGEHEHDYSAAPVLSDDGTKLIYTCTVEGCGETYEEEYVSDTPTVTSEGTGQDTGNGENEGGDEIGNPNVTMSVAQIGNQGYPTLQAALNAANDNDEIKLLEDLTDDLGNITITKSITLEGNGHRISGATSLYMGSAQTIIIRNVKFENIATPGGKRSAIYAESFGGNLTITGCEFNNVQYEAMQIVPSADGAAVNITNNIFNHDTTVTPARYIHIECLTNGTIVGRNVALTVTNNDMLGTMPSNEMMGIYYFTPDSEVDLKGNYFSTLDASVCILAYENNKIINQTLSIYPAKATAGEETDTYTPVAYIHPSTYEYKFYDSTQEAVDAATTGNVVTLLKDTTEKLNIKANHNIILDLNGKTLTAPSKENAVSVLGGTLTVKDSTATVAPDVSDDYATVTYESGKIVAGSTGIAIAENGSVIIESGTIESKNNCGIYAGASNITNGQGNLTIKGGYIHGKEYGVGIIKEGSVLNVEGGVIISDDNTGIGGNGTVGQGGTTINVSGGTIVGHISTGGYIACGIYHPQKGVLNITGGKIYADGGVGVLMRGGELNMTGGEVISTGVANGKVGDSNIIAKCYGILLDGAAGYYDVANSVVCISSNAKVTAKGANTPALMVTEKNGTTGKIVVKGGTFSSEVREEYCAEGYIPTESNDDNGDTIYGVKKGKYVASITNADNETKYYETFADAYDKAVDGATITVLTETDWLQNYEDTDKGGFKIDKNISIDLNGNSLQLKLNDKTDGFYLDLVKADKTLSIKDSKEGGKLSTTNTSYLIRLYGGNLTLENGTLEALSATRTVYLYRKETSVFTMKGGVVVNGKAYGSNKNENAVQVTSGAKAIINGGLIQTTNKTAPAGGIRIDSGTLIVNDGKFETGVTPSIYTTYDDGKGNTEIYGGTFANTGVSVSVYSTGKVTIGKDNGADISIPHLLMSRSGVVDIKDNVTIERLEAVSYDTIPEYTFKAANNFGGKYGNDFSEHIVGNALACQQIEGSKYYKVVPITEDDSRVVAVITHSDDTKSWFGEAGAAFAALINGDKLTLKKAVVNRGKSSYTSTASDVIIELNSFSITAENADCAVYFNVNGESVEADDSIKIVGTGKMKGNKYAVTVTHKGTPSHVFTLDINSGVSLSTFTEGGIPVYLSAAGPMARLLLEGAVTNPAQCTGKFKTTVNDKEYVYASLQTAIVDTTSNKIELTGDTNSSQVTATNKDNVVDIDLGKHTLTFTKNIGIVSNGVGLNIKNGEISHTYNNKSTFAYTVSVGSKDGGQDASSLVLEDVIMSVSGQKATAVNVSGNYKNTNVILKNSTIQCIAGNTNDTVGVYFPVDNGTLDIDNTKIIAASAVQVKGGTVNIKNGSEITATGEKAEPAAVNSGCMNTGDAVYVEDTYGHNPIVNVEGGIIKSTNASALNYFDNSQDNATGKIEVSGGTFSNDVTEYCVIGKKAVASDEGNTYTIGEAEKATIAVYSCMVDSNVTSVANVSGGGEYYERQKVTLKATTGRGLEFKGWYTVSAINTNSAGVVTSINYGEQVSGVAEYTFTMASGIANVNYVAVYEATGNPVRLRIGGADFSVNGTPQQSGYDKTFAVGTQITVAYTGDSTFYHWKNGSDKITSTATEYTFTIVTNTDLTPVFMNEGSTTTSAFVEFISAYNQVLQAEMWSSSDMPAFHSLPTGPSKIGGTFQYWSMDASVAEPEKATVQTILAAVSEGYSKHIIVRPVYEDSTETYTITIQYSESDSDSTTYADLPCGKAVYIEARDIAGKKFSHWSDSAEGGNILSYSQKYGVQVSKNMTLYPIYVSDDEEVTAKPTINITNKFASVVDGINKISFEATRSVPDGYELIEHGILRTTDPLAATSDAMQPDEADITKHKSNNEEKQGIYTLNLAVRDKTKLTVYARGYMIVKNVATGEMETIYSTIEQGSFQTLNSGN